MVWLFFARIGATVMQKEFHEMPNQTKEEQDAVVSEGEGLKQLDIEKEKLRRETDPDDEAHFLNDLTSSIHAMGTGVIELKERAGREQNPEFLKQASNRVLSAGPLLQKSGFYGPST
ncbi:hypothetical protein [Paenibacillus elgii]|uniref:hypothetical protein n=1 Tax=Paenibacillus elgii TaxID=189691 RepID=UPI000FDB6FEE|nr:hypothetical protein [Paenibacillus elgii]NEN86127.1 hypothetical protein [Paenibacillus elgii]